MTVSRQQVVAEARSWLGTPWHHQAALKGIGADCIGYLAGVDRELGLPEGAAWLADPRYKGYGTSPNEALLLEACNEYMDEIPRTSAGLGDVLQLNFRDRGVEQPMHFAIISCLEQQRPDGSIDPRKMLHALALYPRKVVEHGIDEVWESRILRAYRFRGVA